VSLASDLKFHFILKHLRESRSSNFAEKPRDAPYTIYNTLVGLRNYQTLANVMLQVHIFGELRPASQEDEGLDLKWPQMNGQWRS